ncbi:gas vesicle K [Candidatus Atribacteria bacterium RBG_19FT_COMBO_35_14]|uniref:Gas vesicle K n=1 Tax=Candidatus Sediminicultor quintus TaxID=1797291 RepID=A0A1F5A4Z3_9BACT|nr:MAG: gas vesicle K [Candidatus Atribacteria bacterium RBG_19FT_COMBO_35_14]
MPIDIDTENLKHGVLGLVIALVEIIKDALNLQAIKRMEGGTLSEKEVERLGEALMDLDLAIEEIKKEQGVTESVKSVRDGLDSIVDDVLDKMINPERWSKEAEEKGI